MIFENDYKVEIRDIGKNNEATNKAILGYMEDIATVHSDAVGYGPDDVKNKDNVWLLADWKLEVIRRPHYKERLKIKTWARETEMCTSYRDFELYDENNKVIAIATSKWIFFNVERKRIIKILPEVIGLYNPEIGHSVFENNKLDKIKEPENYINSSTYTVRRADIDLNNHMHNLNYLDLAYEVLPKEVYEKCDFSNVRITYKKEIKFGEEVNCLYALENDKHIITIKSLDNKTIHTIIELN